MGYPYDGLLHRPLIGLAYGLILPAIAVLHVRHRDARDSGAVLATIAGTATVAIGVAASADAALRPAALLVLGMWWWTIGKMWVETRLFASTLGRITALLGALAIAAGLIAPLTYGIATATPRFPDDPAWAAGRIGLGAWLVALALVLGGRSRAVPSA